MLLNDYINDISIAAHKAMSDDTQCKSGLHCKYCSARCVCPALQQTVYNCIDVVTNSTPIQLSGSNLSFEYILLKRISKLIEIRLASIQEQIISELISGKNLPGLTASPSYSRVKWKKSISIDDILSLCDAMGIDLRKPVELITPSQSKKLGLDKIIIDNLSEKFQTGFKITEDDGSKARQAFGKK